MIVFPLSGCSWSGISMPKNWSRRVGSKTIADGLLSDVSAPATIHCRSRTQLH
jgi:hypothetical protein